MKAPSIAGLGPKSSQWLAEVGVTDVADIRALGIEAVLRRLFRAGRNPTLNMAYGLAAALLSRDWRELPDEERSQLILVHDAAKRWHCGQRP